MALRQPAASAAAPANSKFEGEGEGDTTTVADVQDTVQTPAPEAAPAPAAAPLSTVKPANTAMAVAGAKYTPALQEFKDQIDPSTLDFDTFPRVTVGLDGFSDDKETDLGKRIKLKLMSWNERYLVTTGVDTEEANKLVQYSLDGKVIDSTGQSTAEYLAFLKSEGYKDAEIKKYYAIYGFLCFANDKDIDQVDQSIVSVQVPPRSVSLFTRFQIEYGVKVAQGIVQPTDVLVLNQLKAKGKAKAYASIEFSADRPAA